MLSDLRREIAQDEGCRYEIYLDHLGKPTVGIGHLCVENEFEFGLPVGTPVSSDRVNELFKRDLEICLDDCRALFSDFDGLPDDAQAVIANMAFNLGRTRLGKFKKFIAAIDRHDWQNAASEMHDSKWRKQVPARAGRLIRRMRAL
tara:strand:+ start:109 stop:546 length:438 start_codon:yes stop_codon:yes gene_type:complete